MAKSVPTPANAAEPIGVNHLVLTVSDLERSHRFWTEIIGFRQVGELAPHPDDQRPMTMRFYAGSGGNHHDLALQQQGDPPSPLPSGDVAMRGLRPGLNHIAVEYPDRETWLRQIHFLQERGVPFQARVNHGMSHSVYITDPDGNGVEVLYTLPPAQWQGDINSALNYLQRLPTEGPESLIDEGTPVFPPKPPSRP